jgi:hypothetical protein
MERREGLAVEVAAAEADEATELRLLALWNV